MSDVSALIGKLKANVAYRRFNAPSTESGQSWPVLDRIAHAQRGDASPSAETSQIVEQTPAEQVAAAQPEEAALRQAAPMMPQSMSQSAQPAPLSLQTSHSPLLRRIQPSAAPAPAVQPEPPAFSALASAAPPPMSAAPEQVLPPQPAAAPQFDMQPEPEPARGSLFQRYAPAVEPEPQPDPSALTNIFARLERKSR
ncbi:hypothetical protein [Phenylobacterium immobile]|uniref:hypothetical protein n=1 Tax=Phenylobacterium immobile TaxID=21 RepID=UPI000A9DA23F|nr:hypothetical protein [Phenylobacterium immobile]